MAHKLALTTLALLVAAGCGGDPAAGAGGSGGGTGAGTAGQGGGASTDVPPTEQNAIFEWLKAGSYAGWSAESGPHPSAGPHGGEVRTFVNPALLGSLTAGDAAHPKGAAAVKELYGSGDTITGWAVSLKTADDSAGGQGFYWYEVLSTTDPSSPVAAGNGVPLCFGCHAGGADHVLTPFPLQ